MPRRTGTVKYLKYHWNHMIKRGTHKIIRLPKNDKDYVQGRKFALILIK